MISEAVGNITSSLTWSETALCSLYVICLSDNSLSLFLDINDSIAPLMLGANFSGSASGYFSVDISVDTALSKFPETIDSLRIFSAARSVFTWRCDQWWLSEVVISAIDSISEVSSLGFSISFGVTGSGASGAGVSTDP